MEMSFMKIGDKIRSAREDMDLSQEEVARLIPINQSSYSKIERDIQEPNLEQLRRICQILKLDPCALESEKLIRAAAIIKDGGLVAFPTETVYGLGADATNANAVKKILKLLIY